MKTTEEYEKEVKALRDQVETLMNAFEASLTELKEKEKPVEERIINLLEGIQKTLDKIDKNTTKYNWNIPWTDTNPWKYREPVVDPYKYTPNPIVFTSEADPPRDDFRCNSEDNVVFKDNKIYR